jgi:hypothetical protein
MLVAYPWEIRSLFEIDSSQRRRIYPNTGTAPVRSE